MTRLILWRHGQSEWNADNRVQGQTDVALSVLGRAQAAESAPRIEALRPEVLVSSDLRRAEQTMAALASLTDLPVALDARFRERFYGEWQGLTIAEIRRRWPAGYARWRAGEPVGEAGIEDVDEVAKRVSVALQEIVDAAPGATIVVATHGGAARHGACALLGWPEKVARALGGLGNCHRTELRFDAVRGWQLAAHNVY